MVNFTSSADNMSFIRNAGVYFVANIRHNLIKKKQNCVMIVVGKPGSGKSTFAISLAMAVDPKFNPDKRIVFSGNEYVDVLRNIEPGDAVVWDETGVGLGSREAMTKVSRNLGKIFQTMRFKRNLIIMTVPSREMIDKMEREMVDCIVDTKRIIYSYNICIARIMTYKKDNIFGYSFNKYPVVKMGNKRIQLRKFATVKPPRQIIERYEVRKKEFFEKNVLDKFDEDYSIEELKIDSQRKEEIQRVEFIDSKVKEIIKSPEVWGRPSVNGFKISKNKVRAVFNISNKLSEDIKAKSEYELQRLNAVKGLVKIGERE